MPRVDAVDRFTGEAEASGLDIEVQRYPDGTRTAADAAAAVGCKIDQIVKSLVFMADGRPVLVLCSGARRVDEDRLAGHLGTEIRIAGASVAVNHKSIEQSKEGRQQSDVGACLCCPVEHFHDGCPSAFTCREEDLDNPRTEYPDDKQSRKQEEGPGNSDILHQKPLNLCHLFHGETDIRPHQH